MLTNETENAFKIIFCEYKRLRKAGFTKEDSLVFKDSSIYEIPAFSEWLRPDIDSAIMELKTAGFIKLNILDDVSLTSEGIIYMENKPREFFNNLSGLFDLFSIFV